MLSASASGALLGQLASLSRPCIDRAHLSSTNSATLAREKMRKVHARDVRRRVEVLKKVKLFKDMTLDELRRAAEAFVEVAYEPGEVVIRQGDIGQDFFIISKGQCVVLYQVDDERAPVKVLAKIGANCFFGELALMTDEARSATIVADASAEEVILLLKMTRYDFERIFHKKTDLETDNLKERRAWEVLSHIDLFGTLSENDVREIIQKMKTVKYQPGTYIIQQGREGKTFYIISEGVCKVTVKDAVEPSGERALCELGECDAFGEAVVVNKRGMRSASVVSVTNCICFAIAREVLVQYEASSLVKSLKALKSLYREEKGSQVSDEDGDDDTRTAGDSRADAMAPLDDEDAAAAFACKFRSMRRAFLVIVASLRDTLLTRVYVRLSSQPKLCKDYGPIVTSAFLSCPDRQTFHRRSRALFEMIRKKPPAHRAFPELSCIMAALAQCTKFVRAYCRDWTSQALLDLCHHVRIDSLVQGDVVFDTATRATRLYLVVRGLVSLSHTEAHNTLTNCAASSSSSSVATSDTVTSDCKAFWTTETCFAETAAPGSQMGIEAFDEPLEAKRVFHRHKATALCPVLLFSIGYEDYYNVLDHVRSGNITNVEEKYGLVKDMQLFHHYKPAQLYHIAYALQELYVPRGKIVVPEGETSGMLFIVRKGNVTVHAGVTTPCITKTHSGINLTVLTRGEYFGESGLLSSIARLRGREPVRESAVCFASTALDLYVLKPEHYGLLDSQVAKRLEKNFRVRASWRRHHCDLQRESLSLPDLLDSAIFPPRDHADSGREGHRLRTTKSSTTLRKGSDPIN